MAREDLVIDLFYGEYHGASKGSKKTDRGVKPKVRKMAKHPAAAITGKAVFPIPISPKDHIFNISVSGGNPDLKILRPTPDMENVDYESTIWAQIQDEIESDVEELREQKEKAQDKAARLEKKVEKLEESEEEKERRSKAGSSGSNNFECDYCGHEMSTSKWKDEDGVCPECSAVYERFEGDE